MSSHAVAFRRRELDHAVQRPRGCALMATATRIGHQEEQLGRGGYVGFRLGKPSRREALALRHRWSLTFRPRGGGRSAQGGAYVREAFPQSEETHADTTSRAQRACRGMSNSRRPGVTANAPTILVFQRSFDASASVHAAGEDLIAKAIIADAAMLLGKAFSRSTCGEDDCHSSPAGDLIDVCDVSNA